MKQLTEIDCEFRNATSLKLPPWKLSSNSQDQDGTGIFDGSNESTPSQTLGGFLNGDCSYAWLSCGTQLVVINVKSGEYISTWTFPDKITTVSSFPTQLGCIPLLLVGLDNNADKIKDSVGHLCIFDCCYSNILTTIQVPAGVEKACVIHGGTDSEEFNEQRPDSVLPDNSGLIFAALRNFQHIIIDVNRDLWEKSCHEGKSITASLEFINPTTSSAMKTPKSYELTYLAYDLMSPEIENYMGFDRRDFEANLLYDENLCSVLLSSTKTGCLISGCLGRVIIWQHDGSIGWLSPIFDENSHVTHLALLEPSDDPKPFYYLWVVYQNDEPDSTAVLRMYMLVFKNKSNKSGEGSSLYFNLESEPGLKFELELEQGEHVHSLLAIERGNPRDTSDIGIGQGEESLLLIGTEERVLLFDLNRWYKEQMPCTMIGFLGNPNSIMASYRTRQDDAPSFPVISSCYVPKSLWEFPNMNPHSPEELFFPNSLKLEWINLTEESLEFWLTRGVQSELLRNIIMAGPIVLVMPNEIYHRCLSIGLVPFDSTLQDYRVDVEQSVAREMLLSLCLDQRWTGILLRCATEWSDGSAAYLYPEFLEWSVKRASELKLITERLCEPLFDESGASIGESEIRTLRYCAQQLECLATVVSKLPNPEAELSKHERTLKRIAAYLQVLLWFYDVGLLPEIQEIDEEEVPMSMFAKIPYPRNKLIESYKRKRRNDCGEENKVDDILFIDQLIVRSCPAIKEQWANETSSDCPNQGGLYPPPSLQSLLRSFLTDCYCGEEQDDSNELPETLIKHCIVIYLLMDLSTIFEGSNVAINQLIKYPAAFQLTPSLIKVTQAFWLLDHEDYERFFNIMTSQLVLNNDIKDWQHKLALNALMKNDQHKLALIYLRVIKPPMSSLDDQNMMIDLYVEKGLVASAFHERPPSHYGELLTRFFRACKDNGKLKEVLHLPLDPEEEEAFVKYLKESDNEEIRLIYYLLRGRHTESSDTFSVDTVAKDMKIQPCALNLLKAFNNTLPNITKCFANSLSKNTVLSGNKSFVPYSMINHSNGSQGFYPKPMSQCRDKITNIYELAIQKTRETCLRPGLGMSNYIPFLTAPYTTINFGPKFASQVSEQIDANCVTYPKRKESSSKRTLRMMTGIDHEVNIEADRKRRKLDIESDLDESAVIENPQKVPRLSLSQMCNTPLVRRKEVREPNSLISETPHSILKIRRDSRSPSFKYGQGDLSDEEDRLRRSTVNDPRRLRQIRFSVSRLSGNDDSSLSANEAQNDGKDYSGSSKNTGEESLVEEHDMSQNLTGKSFRDDTILSDTSMTRNFGRPRPRSSLQRRNSNSSRASSEDLSQKNSSFNDSMINVCNQENSEDNEIMPQTSIACQQRLSPSFHCASILSPDTSVEALLLKKSFTVYNTERNEDDETTEESDEDNIKVFNKFSESEESLSECISSEDKRQNNEFVKEKSNESVFETEVDQEVECGKPSFKVSEKQHLQTHSEEETEDSEEDVDESFQSVSNSFHEKTDIAISINQLEDNCIQDEKHNIRNNLIDEDSFTTNFILNPRNESFNYSLTKPIFSYDKSVVNSSEDEYNITDDDSMDHESNLPKLCITRDTKQLEKDDEDDFTLSFSHSDGSNEEKNKYENVSLRKKKKDGNKNQTTEKKKDKYLERSLGLEQDSSKVASKNKMILEPAREIYGLQSQQVSYSLVESNIESNESPKYSSLKEIRKVSPRRSIRSVSTSPCAKLSESKSDNETKQNIEIMLETEKVKQTTLEKIKLANFPEIRVERIKLPFIVNNREPEEYSNLLTLPDDLLLEPVEDNDEVIEEDCLVEEPSINTSVFKKLPCLKKLRKSSESSESTSEKLMEKSITKTESSGDEALLEEKPEKNTKRRRSASVAKEVAETSRSGSPLMSQTIKNSLIVIKEKVRASPAVNDEKQSTASNRRKKAGSMIINEDLPSARTRSKRAESIAKDEEQVVTLGRRTRAGSVTNDKEVTVTTRRTRARSLLKETDTTVINETRKTRAASLTKKTNEEAKRLTRASSTSKDSTAEKKEEASIRQSNRKRGSSLPKEIPPTLEVTRSQRSRRSTSLLKEVIPEESGSPLEMPTSVKSTRTRKTAEFLTSSPSVNTRNRRSSVQSVPEDFEDILNKPSSRKSKDSTVKEDTKIRNRRATSVDSVVKLPVGKRLTRSLLAKASIIGEIILEESTPVTKKQPGRRKRTASVGVDETEKVKITSKLKKNLKNCESQDFKFSLANEVEGIPVNCEDGCRTPTFEFSKPDGLQKFITPIREEEFSNKATKILEQGEKDSKKTNLSKTLRQPRTCFIMPKKTKDE